MKNKIVTKEVERLMDKYPLYSQDGKPDTEKKVLFKVFNPYGDQTWYILEASEPLENGDRELFAFVVWGYVAEYGSVMLSELTDTRVNVFGHKLPLERDLYFHGTLADAKKESGVA